MGVNAVSNFYQGLIFAGENSRDYGVYITSPAVFNAPERDVEFITIPGRNGDYQLDRGRWNNITVTYSCAFFTDTVSDFNQGLADFRNMLASHTGYNRLEDEINTGEYRMGAFVSGMEVDTFNPKTGTFEVVFTCKPQRWLKSGETAVTVASGDIITNPTLYDASPMLLVNGHGEINMPGATIGVADVPIGDTLIAPGTFEYWNANANSVGTLAGRTTKQGVLGATELLAGDKVYFSDSMATITLTFDPTVSNVTIQAETPPFPNSEASVNRLSENSWALYANLGYFEFPYSTNRYDGTFPYRVSYTKDGETKTKEYQVTISVQVYETTSGYYLKINYQLAIGPATGDPVSFSIGCTTPSVYAYLSKSALGDPLYIDLELGEAYNADSGTPVSVNSAVSMPDKLPVLATGENEITMDDTITSLQVVPRWWQL